MRYVMYKKIFIGFDLLICTLWAWVALGERYTWSTPTELIEIIAVFTRITTIFLLQKSEIRTWLPLSIMSGCLGLLVGLSVFPGLEMLVYYPFILNGIKQLQPRGYTIISLLIATWLWILPVALYITQLYQKKLKRSCLTWGDLFGAILWKDSKAKLYISLLLISIATLYTGLAMNARVCRFACLAAPAISYWLICRYYRVNNSKVGLLIISMFIFYYAQAFSGGFRIGMLGISLAIVFYLGWRIFHRTFRLKLLFVTILYIGVVLPSIAIGYNQYTGMEYARQGFASMEPYNGIFLIRSSTGKCFELRDRYGILVEPEYKTITPRKAESTFWFKQLELKKDGQTDIYDLWKEKLYRISEDDLHENDENENISHNEHICISEDKRITIESGIYPNGGTSPDYWAKWTIINAKGFKHELKFKNTAYMSDVHALRKLDGTTYYIVHCSGKASSSDGYAWLEAYRIVGDSIKEVNVTDGEDNIDNNDFHINYNIPNWYFTTNGAGYDWLFEYDTQTKRLYVPITEDGIIIDRYQVWQFNGEQFVYIDELPHKDLHKSLSTYNCLICYFTTKDYIVRVDSLDSKELRYASWMKPKTMADEPDIILKGGKRQKHTTEADELEKCDDYHFKNGNYEYIVNYCETKLLNEGIGEHHDFLLVIGKNNILIKQEKELD